MARAYQWDKAGRLRQISDKARDEVVRYTHDRRDQIIGVESNKSGRASYDYDDLLNLALSEGEAHYYSPNGEVIKAGDTQYEYDALGRVISRRVERAGFRPQHWHYEWDSFDHLASVRTPDGSLWRYVYDAFGRRVSKECVTVGREAKTVFVWDGARLAEEWREQSGDGEPQSGVRWHYAGGSFAPTAKEIVSVAAGDAASQQFLPIVTDHLGTPRELFDESGTTCLWRSEVSLWGKTRKFVRADADVEAANCPLRFQGQYEDAESGLYYNLNRYYDPRCGMYLSPDPIGLAGGIRPNAYVHNPTAYIDPLGLAGCKPKPTTLERYRSDFTGGRMKNRQADGNELFYRYHGEHNLHGSKGFDYVTNKKYTSEAELRQDLALLKEWGVEITHVTTIKPPKGTWVTEGTAASQVSKNGMERLSGGGYQGLIRSNDLSNSSIISTERVNF